ncbi:MAG: hypothetical protein J6P15_02530 [Fibrobacter sp.]|nr:hypothetical protein [Fibrobacter sp.]
MNMKKTFAAILAASMAASAASVVENQELLESKVDSVNAKRGVEITGAIRAVAQTSRFDTDNDPTGINKMPSVEKDEFVTADINFGFRPWENVRANAMVRLSAGMQEYFASAAKSVSVPWLNVEGNIGNSFYWVVGDFRQQYSPLTLFLPGIDIMYEAQVFARKRYMAEHEQFIEGNQRNLQGANLQFRTDMGETVGELRAEAMFARLNRNVVLDLTGAEGNILPRDSVMGASQASNMDKFVLAGNFEWLPLHKTLYVGVTPMYIFDNEDSYSYTYRHPGYIYTTEYERQDINPFELNPQKTLVVSGRLGADVGSLINNSNLILDITGEVAMSKDDVYKADTAWALEYDEAGNMTGNLALNEDDQPYLEQTGFTKENLQGMAVLVNANVGYKTDDFGVRLAVDFIRNDSNWFNNLAQSPKFFAQRIQNSDKDGQTVKYGVNSPLYSSFDALYNFTPKFSPVATTLGTDDNAFKGSDMNSYSIANYNKNSWTTNVFTRNQLALLETLSDPALQMSLPNGLATANRMGARANLIANIKDFAEVQGLFSFFNQVKPLSLITNDYMGNVGVYNYKAAQYMEFGGGAKVDIFKLIGFTKPLEISGSYKHSERTMDSDGWAALGLIDVSTSLKSDFINAGLYVQYLPRLGVNAGFQMINTEYENIRNAYSALAPLMKGKQMQWMVGLDYNIETHAWLAVNFGMMNVENDYNTAAVVAAGSAEGAVNLPDYYDVTKDQTMTYKHKFSQMILEASLNVEF